MHLLEAMEKYPEIKLDEDIRSKYLFKGVYITANGYLEVDQGRRHPVRRREFMHRLVIPGHEVVHHINRDKLDNRRVNLMGTTQSMNLFLKQLSYNTGLPRGVSLHKESSLYRVRIMKDRKELCLGYFECPIEAGKVYEKYAEKLYPGYAQLVADELEGRGR